MYKLDFSARNVGKKKLRVYETSLPRRVFGRQRKNLETHGQNSV